MNFDSRKALLIQGLFSHFLFVFETEELLLVIRKFQRRLFHSDTSSQNARTDSLTVAMASSSIVDHPAISSLTASKVDTSGSGSGSTSMGRSS
jgi:hypothetical protein